MAHSRRRLNQYGRQVLVDRVLRQGWSVAAAAEALQVSRQTGYRWLRRYRAEGPAGLANLCFGQGLAALNGLRLSQLRPCAP